MAMVTESLQPEGHCLLRLRAEAHCDKVGETVTIMGLEPEVPIMSAKLFGLALLRQQHVGFKILIHL